MLSKFEWILAMQHTKNCHSCTDTFPLHVFPYPPKKNTQHFHYISVSVGCDILFAMNQQTFHLRRSKNTTQQTLPNENALGWPDAKEPRIFCCFAIFGKWLGKEQLLIWNWRERNKKKKTQHNCFWWSKEKQQLKMETGTVTRLWICLFSQASLEWELHRIQLSQLQRSIKPVKNTLLTSKIFHLLLSCLQDSF